MADNIRRKRQIQLYIIEYQQQYIPVTGGDMYADELATMEEDWVLVIFTLLDVGTKFDVV